VSLTGIPSRRSDGRPPALWPSSRTIPARRAVRRANGAARLGTRAVKMRVLCVKFCKGGHGWLESCGLAELDFLVLLEIVHIEIAVGLEPVLVGLDGQGPDEAAAGV
jgi:hypothetical protein